MRDGRESLHVPGALVLLGTSFAALAGAWLVLGAVEGLTVEARRLARERAEVAAHVVRERVATRGAHDPATVDLLAEAGIAYVRVLDDRGRVLDETHAVGLDETPRAIHELSVPLDDRAPARGSLRLGFSGLDAPIDAARAHAVARGAAGLALAVSLVGGAGALSLLLVRRERSRTRTTRTRTRLARLGLLAAGFAQEVRTPLGAIREGLTQLRERLEDEPPWSHGFVSSAALCDRSLADLTHVEILVRDFVAYARPEPNPPRVVDVAALVREWIAILEPELAARDLALVAEGISLPAPALADPIGLKQIFWNLVRNARDAAPRGSIVRISLQSSGERVTLRVADRGPGIARERRDEVFEPFVSTKPDGAGLGLAISQRLADAMGASLGVSGGPPGAVLEVGLRRVPPALRFFAPPPVRPTQENRSAA